jgi:DNA polymerase
VELLFFDFETRCPLDILQVGAYKYARHPECEFTVFTGIFSDADDWDSILYSPPWAWGNTEHSRPDNPAILEQVFDHVRSGGYLVAWNSFFDRQIWNNVCVPKYGWPDLPLEQVLCAQAQAEANNLPGALGKAGECLGTHIRKDNAGSTLMSQLASGTRNDWVSEVFETPEKMGRFRKYGVYDTLTTREIWQCVRPLTLDEWDEYHASERINDRGVAIDIEFAKAARGYAMAEEKDINIDLVDLTDDKKMTVTNHLRKAKWLHDQLYPDTELQQITTRSDKIKVDKDGNETIIKRVSADRPTREAIADLLSTPEHADRFEPDHLSDIQEFIELIEAGNSAAVRKFTAMINQVADDERVHGCYSLNGAGQTGRFSSRGLQVHNIIRAPLEKGNPNRAIDAIEAVMAGWSVARLEKEFGFPISRLLARLIRPTFIAPDGKLLVWGDWEQIEGRVLPWLSKSGGGDAKLMLYREGLDVYSMTASRITGTPVDQISDSQRQAMGKVPELALGFGGAAGAFAAMGRAYGVVLPADQVKGIVSNWREQNPWCVQFWHQLWDAAMLAYSHPGEWVGAGRVRYLYHPTLMRGTLICEIPGGRWLTYPQFRHERVIAEDEKGNEIVRWRTTCMKGFAGGYGRIEIWYGTLAENITQATAASILRDAIVACDAVGLPIVLHTHDELVGECDARDVDNVRDDLRRIMEYVPDWAEGLPLAVEIESGPFYTK